MRQNKFKKGDMINNLILSYIRQLRMLVEKQIKANILLKNMGKRWCQMNSSNLKILELFA